MSDSIFEEGGEFGTKRVGPDQFELHIPIPTDEDGLVGRECPDSDCAPGYFKIKPGTGITEGQTTAYCPYCRFEAEPRDFATQAQKDYALGILKNEAVKGINRTVQKSFGFGSSHKKIFGFGMIRLEMSYKPLQLHSVSKPIEEELRRDITCPTCGLAHAVFGLATWCPDCGTDIFLKHVDAEFDVILKALSAVDARKEELGPRIAGRDIENALEDTVSVFEAVMKIITRKYLLKAGVAQEEVEKRIEKIRNSYQNIGAAGDTYRVHTGQDLFIGISIGEIEVLKRTFEKRHPITHNAGVADRKYISRIKSGESEGREVHVTAQEVEQAVASSQKIITNIYRRI